jgi:hypothetical protein
MEKYRGNEPILAKMRPVETITGMKRWGKE